MPLISTSIFGFEVFEVFEVLEVFGVSKILPPPVIRSSTPLQFSGAEAEPLMVMLTVEPELVSVAEPRLTMQLVVSGELGQVPLAVTVAVVPLAVNIV